jgi:AcrR family transcriptional regulator
MNNVQYQEDSFMNTVVTSKEEILNACRKIVSEQGLSAVNMRSVAQKCNVALGSLYNYFPNKDELLLSTIETVWHDIFHMEHPGTDEESFSEIVEWIFTSIQKSTYEYPNFFTAHSLSITSNGKNAAKDMMKMNLRHIKTAMRKCLNQDQAVRKDAFSKKFTKDDFINFVLDHIILLILQNKKDCKMLLEVVERTIY